MSDLRRAVAVSVLATVLCVTDAAFARTAGITAESYMVPSRDPGLHLFVRNKRPEGVTQFTSDKVLLFVHGATYPSETAFDLSLDGLSCMDYIAQRGWDVYLMDVRGYGRSTRPEAMGQPAEASSPIVNADVAVTDVATVVDHILARRGIAKVNLLGWSWGTAIMGAYAAQNNDKVERLVLFAPLWLLKDATPPVVRAPNGIIEDLKKYWMANTPHYDPAQIRVPTLLIHAEWDADTPAYMSQALFAKLTSVPTKRYVVIGEGTHTVLMEKNRAQLFREVQLFLDEPAR